MRGKTEFTYSNLLFEGGTVSVEELVMIAGNEMGCESPASSIDNCMAELFPEAILIFELVLAKTLSSFFFNSKNFVKRVLQFATSLMMAILNIKMSLCAWIRIRFLQYPNVILLFTFLSNPLDKLKPNT